MAWSHLLLIRHAKNDWVGERLPGLTPGIHLSEEGRREAEGLAARLADYPIDLVFSSTLERARETAEYLAKPRGLTLHTVPELVDVDVGELTGMALKEASEHAVWRGIQLFPSTTHIPGGESIWDMQTRVVRALESIRRAHEGKCVAVVAHADVIKVAVAHYLGLHLDLFQRIEIATTSVSLLTFTGHGARLITLNHTATVPLPGQPKEPAGSGDNDQDAANG